MNRPLKVACFSIVPSPYQRDLFDALAQRPEVDLRVFYNEAASPDSPWPKKTLRPFEEILRGFYVSWKQSRFIINYSLPKLDDYDVIILNGYTTLAAQRILRSRPKAPMIFWAEKMVGPQQALKRRVHKFLSAPLDNIQAVVAIGKAAQEDYRHRFPSKPVYALPYTCSLEEFRVPRAGGRVPGAEGPAAPEIPNPKSKIRNPEEEGMSDETSLPLYADSSSQISHSPSLPFSLSSSIADSPVRPFPDSPSPGPHSPTPPFPHSSSSLADSPIRPFPDSPPPGPRPSALGPSAPPTLLFCGQMIERKGVDLLLKAFTRIIQSGLKARLLLVGREADLPLMLEAVPEDVQESIDFAGFQAPEALPAFFAQADIFVLPSRYDGWGVVVNQAVGAGLSIISSTAVGAAADLVREGFNGATYEPEDVDRLTDLLAERVRDPELRRREGEASRELADEITPEAAAARWVRILEQSVGVEHASFVSQQ